MNRKVLPTTLAALMLAFALYGCGSSGSSNGDSDGDATSTSGASGATTIESLQDEWASYPQDMLVMYKEAPEAYEDLPKVTPDELHAIIESGDPIVLVDTNSASMYADGHIEGAVNIPWDIDGFKQDPNLPRGVPLYFYCVCEAEEDSGHMGLSAVRDWGYRNVTLLQGGTPAWEEAGYELIPS